MANRKQEIIGVLDGLGNRLHIERVKAQARMKDGLEEGEWRDDHQLMQLLYSGVEELLVSDEAEKLLGGLLASVVSLEFLDTQYSLVDLAVATCRRCLEHEDVRVRMAVGETFGALALRCGVKIYEEVGWFILESIRKNFDRDEDEEGTPKEPPVEDSAGLLESLLESSYKPVKPGTGDVRHGTEGWKCLETSFRALTKIMEGCGAAFRPHLDEDLINLVFEGTLHLNRFVREISYFGIGMVCTLLGTDGVKDVGSEVAIKLAKGLADDWSQVRYVASKSTRIFMGLIAEDTREELYPHILPQMCLNRYYVAEGVKLFSQETWQIVLGQEGRMWVGKLAPYFIEFYTRQCAANNHAVREAACACIAELMTKVESTAIQEFVPRLLASLINCFKDASWPVRDAACQACGRCVLAFPEESRPVMDELYGLWFAHLWDNIGSVREDSAVALGNVIRAYREEALERILPVLRDLIMKAQDQPKDSTRFSNMENVTQFGVAAMRIRADDDKVHTDQQMFSCGSLAPKLARGGGCMDHGFKREREAWEASDGAVYLVRELSCVDSNACVEFLPNLADLARIDGFLHAHNLHETVWKVVPEIAKNMGKRAFKSHLELFLNPMFVSVKCGHQLEGAAAGRAIGMIRDYLGVNIFKGRLEDHQKMILESNMNVPPERGMLGAGGM
ncbi:hypothetical protein BSKO_00411 [Bryopsis sp. KO-2023]|nr:hypothetical protein BSKO_00411 [Bryopsis sp. KO-2023]